MHRIPLVPLLVGLAACTRDTDDTSDTDTADSDVPVEPRLAIVDLPMPVDLTTDGGTALLQDLAMPLSAYRYDTATDELAVLAEVGDPTRDLATGLADDGAFTALHGDPVQAGVWRDGTWTDLGSPYVAGCDQDVAGAWDLSADGGTVVGLVWHGCVPEAFVWTGGDAVTPLDVLGATLSDRLPTNRASAVSDDGGVIGGFAENGAVDRSPAVWSSDGAGFLLDPDDQDAPGEVLAVSGDGSVVGGTWGNEGFVWSEAGGRVDVGRPEGALPSDPTFVNALTADGARAFGGSGDAFMGIPIAFAWDAETGARPLAALATAAGVELPADTALTTVLAANADGTVLLGVALDLSTPMPTQRSFVLHLPTTAYAP